MTDGRLLISDDMKISMASQEPQAKEFWQQISPDGYEPSVDDFLKFCINRAKFRIAHKL